MGASYCLGLILGNPTGASASQVAELEYLASEPSLAGFTAPGVATVVTYGRSVPTLEHVQYDSSFVPGKAVPAPSSVTTISGDGVVPVKSSTRSKQWAESVRS